MQSSFESFSLTLLNGSKGSGADFRPCNCGSKFIVWSRSVCTPPSLHLDACSFRNLDLRYHRSASHSLAKRLPVNNWSLSVGNSG